MKKIYSKPSFIILFAITSFAFAQPLFLSQNFDSPKIYPSGGQQIFNSFNNFEGVFAIGDSQLYNANWGRGQVLYIQNKGNSASYSFELEKGTYTLALSYARRTGADGANIVIQWNGRIVQSVKKNTLNDQVGAIYVQVKGIKGKNTLRLSGAQMTIDQIFLWRPEYSGAWGSQRRISGDGWNVTIGHTLIDFTKKSNRLGSDNDCDGVDNDCNGLTQAIGIREGGLLIQRVMLPKDGSYTIDVVAQLMVGDGDKLKLDSQHQAVAFQFLFNGETVATFEIRKVQEQVHSITVQAKGGHNTYALKVKKGKGDKDKGIKITHAPIFVF